MSDCACVSVSGDWDPPAFYAAEMRRARKDHKCDECRRVILPGEVYERTTAKWDESISSFKTCVDCQSARDSFFCNGYLHGSVWDDLEEHLNQVVRFGDGVASSCIVPLTPRARDRVCDFIEEFWSEMDDEDS